MPGLTVRVLGSVRATTGEPSTGVPATSTVGRPTIRGEYRAFGLPPGGCVLANPPEFFRIGGRGSDDIRQMASPQRVSFAPVFHPGVTDIAAAATVLVGVSEERSGIDVMMQLVPTATISGRIDFAGGALPQGMSVTLVPAGPKAGLLSGAGLRSQSAQPRADGTHADRGRDSGDDTIKAAHRTRGAAHQRMCPPSRPRPTSSSMARIRRAVDAATRPPVNGCVVFDGSRPSAAELQTLSFSLAPTSAAGRSCERRRPRRCRRTLRVRERRARYLSLRRNVWNAPGAGDRWAIAASVANGRDAF